MERRHHVQGLGCGEQARQVCNETKLESRKDELNGGQLDHG